MDQYRIDRHPGGVATKPNPLEEWFREGVGRIGQSNQATRRGQHLPGQFDAFACHFGAHVGNSGDIATRPGEARDQSGFDRISGHRHDNRNVARRLLRRPRCRREPGHDHIDFEPHQLRRQIGQPACLAFIRAELVSDVSPLEVTELAHRLAKQPPEFFRTGRSDYQHTDDRHFRLLRGAGERPQGCRAGDQSEEFAPPHPLPPPVNSLAD